MIMESEVVMIVFCNLIYLCFTAEDISMSLWLMKFIAEESMFKTSSSNNRDSALEPLLKAHENKNKY